MKEADENEPTYTLGGWLTLSVNLVYQSRAACIVPASMHKRTAANADNTEIGRSLQCTTK